MDEMVWAAIAGGVALAWGVEMCVTDNPADIPIGNVAIRSVPGIGLFFLIGMVLSGIVFELVVRRIPGLDNNRRLQIMFAVLTGFLVPQTAKLKDKLLTRRLVRNYPFL